MVDGVVASIGDRADPESASIEIDGVPLPVRPGLVYYLLYKPVGVISTRHDDRGRQTVVDLVPNEPPVYPVGRLDADSEGLLILTNDGDLTHRLTHPSFGVTKTYTVLVDGSLGTRHVDRLTSGVVLDDGPARAMAGRLLDRYGGKTLVELTMTEGRNREVRRMVATLGFDVERLVRTAIADLQDRALTPSESRPLSTPEVRALYASSTDGAGSGTWQNPPASPLDNPGRQR